MCNFYICSFSAEPYFFERYTTRLTAVSGSYKQFWLDEWPSNSLLWGPFFTLWQMTQYKNHPQLIFRKYVKKRKQTTYVSGCLPDPSPVTIFKKKPLSRLTIRTLTQVKWQVEIRTLYETSVKTPSNSFILPHFTFLPEMCFSTHSRFLFYFTAAYKWNKIILFKTLIL